MGNNRGSNNSGGEGKKGNDNAKGNSGGKPPENNTNAVTHGVHADPANVIKEFTDDEKEFVDSFQSNYLEIAPFGGEDPRSERLRILGIKAAQEWRGERVIAKEGPSVKSIAFVDDDGTEHTELKEHHLARFTSRLSKDIRQNLKDLGCLPSGEADSTSKTLAEMLSQKMSEEDEQDEEEPIDVESSAVDSEDEDDG